jgi:hypothetical protein
MIYSTTLHPYRVEVTAAFDGNGQALGVAYDPHSTDTHIITATSCLAACHQAEQLTGHMALQAQRLHLPSPPLTAQETSEAAA